MNWWLARHYGAGADYLPAWNGSQAFLFGNSDPYSSAISQKTQLEFYGRAAKAGEYPYALDVPFPLLLIYVLPLFLYRVLFLLVSLLPFSTLSLPIPDASWIPWVRAFWMTFSEIGITLLVFFALRLADWQPKRWFTFLLLAISLTSFYSASALLDGSFSILLALALVGAFYAMRDFNDELAGFLLAISAMKWEVTLLPWFFLFLAVLTARRWRVFTGLAMTWILLGGISFLIYPGWPWPYLRAVIMNWSADDLFTPTAIFHQWIPDLGGRVWFVFESIFLLILLLEWFGALRGKDYHRVAWVAALALAFTPLLGFSTTLADLAPLVFSFAFILPFAWERWKRYPYALLTLIAILLFAFPLILKLPIVASRLPVDGLIFMIPPLAILVGLYWVRWTVIHPPRTWLDGVRRELGK